LTLVARLERDILGYHTDCESALAQVRDWDTARQTADAISDPSQRDQALQALATALALSGQPIEVASAFSTARQTAE